MIQPSVIVVWSYWSHASSPKWPIMCRVGR